ncbi:membrane protein YdbS with pleckstrin-like domain [Microbacterium phyllosphaerae]|uniref:Membrane protein YdbS with pleckstrin-like domain n=1 Tax=Microbacterium phyllosphaerae TaxID=124798 RepID=A0ABS4WM32_9MICO|nr:hypothetical protein [Microbacterium phyllosphaerae]MBP2377251.1 membrane protein YdbS with pleckstrin-like domain [Microbacterium phyllosphaerae]
MRITTLSVQAGIVVAAVILVPMIGVVLLVADVPWGFAWSIVAITALVVFAARTFRAVDEPLTPRPWWQMTARPSSSGVLSALFLAQAASTFFMLWTSPLVVPSRLSAAVLLVIAAAYANSAFQLARRRNARVAA